MPNKELNSAIFTDLAQPSVRQGAEDEGGSCHIRGLPPRLVTWWYIRLRLVTWLICSLTIQESLLDILWSDLITLPIHQRVSVPANCPLIVPGVSIVTREDLSSQLLSIANIPQISPSLVRKERKGKRKIPLQYSFRMASISNKSFSSLYNSLRSINFWVQPQNSMLNGWGVEFLSRL